MPSRAESLPGAGRLLLEGLAHGLALAVLAWLLVRSLGAPAPGPAERAAAAELPRALARWSTVDRPSRIHVLVDADVAPATLAWLSALARTGTPVTWEGHPVPVAAIDDPLADPAGGSRVFVAAPEGTAVTLDDGVGPLDSVVTRGSGAGFLARSGPRWVRARTGALAARAALPDSLVFGRLLLLGRVGWESKFVAAALEERGWTVDARLALSPKGNVAEGPAVRLDTARYSAVIVLDSVAPSDLGAVASYLRSGGGAILTTAALRAPPLAPLGAAGEGAGLRGGEPFDTSAADPRRSLAATPVADRPGQMVLEGRGGRTTVAARRVEWGRLVIIGYQDTWRWRMAGPADAAERHRDWWADLVAGVARVERVPRSMHEPGTDEAPFAHLVDRLGPAAPMAAQASGGLSISNGVLFSLLAGLLLLGWSSRRLRGAP